MSLMVGIDEARKLIEDAEIIIEEGEVYTVYACGHVFLSTDDPQILKYFPKKNANLRSCPTCDKATHLIAKYKLCGCGAEQIGNSTLSSRCCKFCPSARKMEGKPLGPIQIKRNGHLADSDRWNCVHREKCLDKFIDFDAIPCAKCNDYSTGKGEMDPLYTTKNTIGE